MECKQGEWIKFKDHKNLDGKYGIIIKPAECSCCSFVHVINEGDYKHKIDHSNITKCATGKVKIMGDELDVIPEYNKRFAFYGIKAPSVELAIKLLKQSKVILPDGIYLYGKKV